VIVTGGAGFIGSSVVDALVAQSAKVLVLDDLSCGDVANLRDALNSGARIEAVDIRNGQAVLEHFRRFRPDIAVHLAAQIDVRVSMGEPARDASINVLGALNLFEAACAFGVRRVVNTSTGGAIYGVADVVPTSETAPAAPVSAYGLSKFTAERYARWFREAKNLDVVTLRYGNVYGPRQDPRGDAGVVAVFCRRLLAGSPITIYGDGTQTRDYVYVGDVVAANLVAAFAPSPATPELNIGSGTEVSVLELAEQVAVAVGLPRSELVVEFAPARPGELARSCLDITRARRELRLAPPTPLSEGLARTVAWARSCGATRNSGRTHTSDPAIGFTSVGHRNRMDVRARATPTLGRRGGGDRH
jgi:UDP-glucose 4-epimerase